MPTATSKEGKTVGLCIEKQEQSLVKQYNLQDRRESRKQCLRQGCPVTETVTHLANGSQTRNNTQKLR